MNNFKYKKILFLILMASLLLVNKVQAAFVELRPSKDTVGKEEQFYVDLLLDTEGESINTIGGDFSFSGEDVSLLRVEDGKSMVNYWVEKPELVGNKVNFAGVITGGFSGVIDPFNLDKKLPGLIARFVFEAKNKGEINFATSKMSLNLNDGLGTEITALPVNTFIKIGDYINKIKYKTEENGLPELQAYVTKDPNIFDNRFVLVFKASDKGGGIKSVMIKEGRRDWKEIESPYLLKDQTRHSDISLQAINYSGAGVSINIEGIPYNWKSIINFTSITVSILILLLLVIIIKRMYANKK